MYFRILNFIHTHFPSDKPTWDGITRGVEGVGDVTDGGGYCKGVLRFLNLLRGGGCVTNYRFRILRKTKVLRY